jgi:pimeloyl-ACP methyl ester carboxylesterase
MLAELRSISAGGHILSWREAGDGLPVVLLHGVGSGSASWEGQLDGLGADYRVIAWDAPGYGGSDALGGETPVVADYARSLADLLDALDLDRVHLVGHSLGALIAAAFAARRADRLMTLTLADPTAGYAAAGDDLRVGRLEARIRAIEELGPAGMAERRSRDVLSPNASEAAVAKVREVMSRLRPEGYKQAARMMHSTDIYGDAGAVSVPALVMCGSADRVTPEELARSIAAVIPGAEYQTLDGLGHASYVENPELFNALLRTFLGDHS